MNKQPTLQGILSQFVGNYAQQHSISPVRYKVIRHLTACRTPALGGQFVRCDTCDFQQHRYHSCRNIAQNANKKPPGSGVRNNRKN